MLPEVSPRPGRAWPAGRPRRRAGVAMSLNRVLVRSVMVLPKAQGHAGCGLGGLLLRGCRGLGNSVLRHLPHPRTPKSSPCVQADLQGDARVARAGTDQPTDLSFTEGTLRWPADAK